MADALSHIKNRFDAPAKKTMIHPESFESDDIPSWADTAKLGAALDLPAVKGLRSKLEKCYSQNKFRIKGGYFWRTKAELSALVDAIYEAGFSSDD